jgi:hypothetical protein
MPTVSKQDVLATLDDANFLARVAIRALKSETSPGIYDVTPEDEFFITAKWLNRDYVRNPAAVRPGSCQFL